MIAEGYICFKEISRDFIKLGKEKGIDNYFKEDPHSFSNYLWERRKEQFTEAQQSEESFAFFDRGVHDVVAYLNHVKAPINAWEKELDQFRYDLVFLVKPVALIYKQDEDRMETFDEALKVHESLEKTYSKSNIEVIHIPFTTPEKRLNITLNQCVNG